MDFSSSSTVLRSHHPSYPWWGCHRRRGGYPGVAGFRWSNIKAAPFLVPNRASEPHLRGSMLQSSVQIRGWVSPSSVKQEGADVRAGKKGNKRLCSIGAESGSPGEEQEVVRGPAGRAEIPLGGGRTPSEMDTGSLSLGLRNERGGGDSFDGYSCKGQFPPSGRGGGGSSGGGNGEERGGDEEGDEFGPVLKFGEVMKMVEARERSLPSDMYEAAETVGIRRLFLENYLNLQDAAWPLGGLVKMCPWFRDRMLADPQFLFKVGTEILIDSCCATFAEVQKRGTNFWSEFELYAADLLVGIVVDIALVGMLAPYARIGKPSASKGLLGDVARVCGALPSSVFEAERPGCKFSIPQRIGTYFYKGALYGSVGFACGLIGQGIANLIMILKRSVKKSSEDVPVPPLVKSAILWGIFLAISSNTRYQIINGLERIVESSPVAKRVPTVAMAFTVGIRFANNIYGGMQFVDWAKWSGVQ